MSKQSCCVSIGMPVYNGEEHIREALNSLLAQTYADFELIISDNASTDATEAICREYAQQDSRIRYLRQAENQGPMKNFQYVLNEAKGEYFMWAAHDDRWGDEFLAAGVKALTVNRDAVAAFGEVEYSNPEGDVFLIDSAPYGLSGTSDKRIATYLQVNIPDHLIYGLFRRAFLIRQQWNVGVFCPEKLIIFNAVAAGGYADAPGMKLSIYYKAKTKTELESFGLYYSRRQELYMSYLMAKTIWRHSPFSDAIKLLTRLLKYRTPVVSRILQGALQEHPGRVWPNIVKH